MSRALPIIRNRAYESASTSWRLEDWSGYSYGPNAALDDLELSRARAQDATRNNPWLAHGLRVIVSHLIGCGIQPRPKIEDRALRADVLDLWDASTQELDADGVNDFGGWQALATRARIESGEAFIRLRPRLPSDGLTVPFQVQVIEGALCPVELNGANGANAVRQGIEITPFGKRAAYWLLKQHPGEMPYAGQERIRVPAEYVLHHYTPNRPGQLRGAPDTLSALLRARKLDLYESAELTRKQNRAKFNGAITRLDPSQNPLSDNAAETDGSRSLVDIEEGYMLQLAPGESADLYNGDTGGQGAIDYLRTHLRAIAAAMGVPYELLTGDYEGTNDRIMRVILNAFYRTLEIEQDRFIAQVLRPIWRAWLDAAVLSGALRLPNYTTRRAEYQRCEWRAHAWSYVNPLQEVQTKILKIDHGLSARSDEVAGDGWDAEDVDRKQYEDHQREERYGLDYRPSTAVAQQQDTATNSQNSAHFAALVKPISDAANTMLLAAMAFAQRAPEPAAIKVQIDPGETHVHLHHGKTIKTPIRDENGLIARIEEHQEPADG
jgi:lambda family phage portal protein